MSPEPLDLEPRSFERWTEEEDRELLEFDPRAGEGTLRAWARKHGRSYYAVRLRRKRLQQGKVQAERERLSYCPRCGRALPEGQRRGHCPDCAKRNRDEARIRRRERTQERTKEATRRHLRWSPAEDADLLDYGVNVATARSLGRTLYGCRARRDRFLAFMREVGIA